MLLVEVPVACAYVSKMCGSGVMVLDLNNKTK